VCAYDEACCTTGWDADCVSIANFVCGSGFTEMVDAFRGGPLGETRGRAQPPAGWIPPRQRAAMRGPREFPPTVEWPKRPAAPATGVPRSDGIDVKPSKGSPATPVTAGSKATITPPPGSANGGKPTGGK
jgi:hypothetical protein